MTAVPRSPAEYAAAVTDTYESWRAPLADGSFLIGNPRAGIFRVDFSGHGERCASGRYNAVTFDPDGAVWTWRGQTVSRLDPDGPHTVRIAGLEGLFGVRVEITALHVDDALLYRRRRRGRARAAPRVDAASLLGVERGSMRTAIFLLGLLAAACGDDDDDVAGDASTDTHDDAGDATPDVGGCGICGPGEVCIGDTCLGDCRMMGAQPCAVGTTCSTMSGACVMPGEECTPPGDFVTCGTREFAPVCGPGSRCETDHCEVLAGCREVVCDAAGTCRGVGCPTEGGAGVAMISSIEIDQVDTAPRGRADGLMAHVAVEGMGLCGLTVTVEVRIETAVYTSAAGDDAIHQIDLETGMRTPYATGISSVFGLATDPGGALYVLKGDSCELGRVEMAGGMFTRVATVPDPCARVTIGPDGAIYVAGGLIVTRVDQFTGDTSEHGRIPSGAAEYGETFLTGLAFARDGRLIVGEHWRSLFAIPAGGGMATMFADAPDTGLTESDVPWNEGMAFDHEGTLFVGVFPSNVTGGFIYTVGRGAVASVLLERTDLMDMVPTSRFIGIHGVAFGLEGSLYFANQNTDGATGRADGQVLARRDDRSIDVLSEGINFDWPQGFDGDLIVGTRVVETQMATVTADGSVDVTLDVPDVDGTFEVRAYAIDPTSGIVHTTSEPIRTE